MAIPQLPLTVAASSHLAPPPPQEPWLSAQQELQKIGAYKTPRDKLVCILNCCKRINGARRTPPDGSPLRHPMIARSPICYPLARIAHVWPDRLHCAAAIAFIMRLLIA